MQLSRETRKPDVAFKSTGFLMSYAGLALQGELALRLTSFLAVVCSYTSNWLKWPKVAWSVILLQSGLLLRAAALTWRVFVAASDVSLNAREQALYAREFERLGLTRKEFHGLLRAGAEWRTWTPEAGGERFVFTREGTPVEKLTLITAGTCEVYKGGTLVSTLGRGALIGEGSFARRE